MNAMYLVCLCQQWTNILLGAWAVVSGLEWLSNTRLLKPKALLDWSILGSRPGFISCRPLNKYMHSEAIFRIIQKTRIVLGLYLIVFPSNKLCWIALAAIFVCCIYTGLRCCFGADGSDQMGMIMSIGAGLISAGNSFNDVGVAFSGILLVAGQLLLSYFIAGVAKIVSAVWRNGEAVRGVMGTEAYGHPLALRVMERNRWLSVTVGWSVILLEIGFPVIVFLPWTAAILLLCLAGLFHAGNAVFMGLNTFVIAFVSGYPSILVANIIIRHALVAGYVS